MTDQTNNTQTAFMEVTSKKVDAQDKKITILEEKLKAIPDNKELIQKLISRIDGLQEDVKASRFPMDKLNDFASRLDFGIKLLRQPVENKVLHHHHVTKLLWIAGGLFLSLSLVCAEWYNSGIKLDGYIANDTKYRYLRLDTAEKGLQLFLDRTDSLYNTKSEMRKIVLETEVEYRKNFERLIKAARLKAEAKDLEKEVREK